MVAGKAWDYYCQGFVFSQCSSGFAWHFHTLSSESVVVALLLRCLRLSSGVQGGWAAVAAGRQQLNSQGSAHSRSQTCLIVFRLESGVTLDDDT